jgi:hypothetical protein
MRKLVMAAALVAISTPAFAQNASDPDKNVAEGGVKVAGWQARLDRPTAKITDLKFVSMGPGYHVTAGPAAVYWNPANAMKVGTKGYTVKATFAQTKAPTHPEAYGLVVMGTDLSGPNQNYTYFLVRGDGKYMVKHRYHDDVHTLQDWTENAAIKKQDADGKATNEVAISVGPTTTTFWANGTQVFSLNSKDIVGDGKNVSLDGLAGIRVNHNLDVHVAGFSATPNK